MGLTEEAKKEYQREYMRKRRSNSGSNKTDGSNTGLTEDVTPPVTPNPVDGWPDVKAYISREVSGMANLERLQRIAGSLGKRAGDVWFGVSGLTMEDIGSVLGTREGKYARS